LDAIAGGWGLSIINTMFTGLPLNVTYSNTTQASESSLLDVTGQRELNPIPPWKILKADAIDPLGISVNQLEKALAVDCRAPHRYRPRTPGNHRRVLARSFQHYCPNFKRALLP